MTLGFAILQMVVALLLAPLLPGIINRVKAFFAGRQGLPTLQLYYDINKLLRKSPVYSRTTTQVFRIAPWIALSSITLALTMLPAGNIAAPLHFTGDAIFALYLLAIARFGIILAALDTGSAFEGMGASREALYSALAEPVLAIAWTALALFSNSFSLSDMFPGISDYTRLSFLPMLLLSVALFIVMLAENSRIPFDDPNTHLELTMVHEVMVLDHSGPELAIIQYGAALKLWIFASLIANLLPHPFTSNPIHASALLSSLIIHILIIFFIALLIGLVESITSRVRLSRTPELLLTSGAIAVFALVMIAGWKL